MIKRNNRLTKLLLIAFFLSAILFSSSSSVSAVVKDTDADGLTDDAEINVYQTDPNTPDTDGDGVSDGQEILNGTDPVDATVSVPIVKTTTDPGILGTPDKFPWYFARAAGIFAFILLTASSAFGLVISSRAFMKVIPGLDAYEFHRSLSLASVIAVVLHFGAFFFEGFLKMTPAEVLIPFLFSRTGLVSALGFETRIPIALGVIALYLVITLVLTAEFRTKMPPKIWRIVHYVSFAAYPLFLIHGFMSGTDSKEGWMQAIYVFSVSLISVLVITRIVSRTIIPMARRRKGAISGNG